MSLFVLSFGSFGDIITLVGLVNRCRKALCESSGASQDYQDLVLELTSFASLLQSVQDIIFDSENSNRNLAIKQVRDELELTLKEAKKTLDGFNGLILMYKASLGQRGGTGRKVKDSWMKIGWSLLKAAEVREMRQKLDDYQQKLMLLMGIYSGCVFSISWFEVAQPVTLTFIIVHVRRRGLEELGDMQHQHEAIVEQLTNHVMRQNQLIAKAPIANLASKFIKFIDPLGDEFPLPYAFCESPEVSIVICSHICPSFRFHRTDASRGDRCCIGSLESVTRPRSEGDISSEATTI